MKAFCKLSNPKKLGMFMLKENDILECFHKTTIAHTCSKCIHNAPVHTNIILTHKCNSSHLFVCIVIFEYTHTCVHVHLSLSFEVSN